MQLIVNQEVKANVQLDSYTIQCFTETPRKTAAELPAGRIGAFDLFNLFTAEIIRSNKEFTR